MTRQPTTHRIRRESPADSGWLSTFLDDDLRRFVVALAAAVALHELFAGAFPAQTRTLPVEPAETITIAKLTRIEHRATPTPSPTPQPVVPTKVVAETHVRPQIVNPGNPSMQEHVRRIASAHAMARTKYHSKPATVHFVTGGSGAGSTKAKNLTGGVGPGGSGSGESGNGNGTGGAPEAQEPCGYVEFQPTTQPVVDQSTGRIWEHMSAIIHFPDGSMQSVVLDYPFFYQSQAVDPFMPKNSNIPATFQPPPANLAAGEPPLVQYIIAHSSADGYTRLRDCPSPAT